MKIKICGLKTLENSLAACEAGADFLGFNFYDQSVRYISPDACRSIVKSLKEKFPHVLYTGIFVNQTVEEISTILDFCQLDLAQLSGGEPIEVLSELGNRAFKTIRPTSRGKSRRMIEKLPLRGTPPAFLLDSHHSHEYGGTGNVGDWKLAEQIAKEHLFLLAGGLNPENVGAAITNIKPWGVDVASGVERIRGVKDPVLIETFVKEVREIDNLEINKGYSQEDNYVTRDTTKKI